MTRLLLTSFSLIVCMSASLFAQKIDSTADYLQKIPIKYITQVDSKIKKYSSRITSKTEKTLSKLSRWENKIKVMLQKVNPQAATLLFENNQLTFTSLLQKLKEGETVAFPYQASYNQYRDELSTGLTYLSKQKELLDSGLITNAIETGNKMKALATEEDKAEAIKQFIRERKKQLAEQVLQYIGKSRYLKKINKEAYYYAETLKNYKELFSEEKKAEETTRAILNKIPAFKLFLQKSSQLSTLFNQSGGAGDMASIAGLQTRGNVQSLIQDRIAAGGPNALQQAKENIEAARAEINQLEERILSNLQNGMGGSEPPDFRPNMQKTKTFLQRLEYGYNLQFAKSNNLLPTTSDIALSVGYKINDKSIVGAGASYKLGLGSIKKIRFTNEGIGLRSFIDWKLKKEFFISGGYEFNLQSQFKNFAELKEYDPWQKSALIGLTKKLNVKTKLFKSTKFQLLYDFLCRQHVPTSQPVLFRIGYSF